MDQSKPPRNEQIRKVRRHRNAREKEQLQKTILQAAGELFLQLGYDRFSMRKLAENIGYSPATLYLYFRDKDEILFTVVDEGFNHFAKQLNEAISNDNDPWSKLEKLGQAYVSFGLQNPVHYQLMFMHRVDYLTQVREGEQSPRVNSFKILQNTVQEAIDSGVMEPGDAKSYGDVLWALMHGVVALSITMPIFDEKRIQKMSELARRTIYQAFNLSE